MDGLGFWCLSSFRSLERQGGQRRRCGKQNPPPCLSKKRRDEDGAPTPFSAWTGWGSGVSRRCVLWNDRVGRVDAVGNRTPRPVSPKNGETRTGHPRRLAHGRVGVLVSLVVPFFGTTGWAEATLWETEPPALSLQKTERRGRGTHAV